MTIKNKLENDLEEISKRVRNPDSKSNVGTLLYQAFVMHTISDIAETNLKALWKQLVAEKLIPDEDTMRETEGEKIYAESAHFSLMVKVSKPRQTFDKDAFIALIAKRHKIPVATLVKEAELCYSSTKAPLSRKVLEV